MTQLTDYTQQSTFQTGYGQQTRIVKYFRDIILNWMAQPANIKDKRILSMLYLPNGQLRPGCIKVDTPYDPDKAFAGTTPAIIVSRGPIKYDLAPVNTNPLNSSFLTNPTQAMVGQFRQKTFSVNINVITQSHDGTDLIAELLQLFLVMNHQAIREDCNLLNFVQVSGVSEIQAVRPAEAGNAKQVYAASIALNVGTHVTWTEDTQGPVFTGIRLTANLK